MFTGNGEEGVNNEIELNPYQLFQEESISEVNNGGEYNEIAKKLFEMALEGFGKLLLEKSESQEKLKKKNDDDDDEPVVTTTAMIDEININTRAMSYHLWKLFIN